MKKLAVSQEPKESILVASEGHFHQLAKFATKVSDRTVHVMNNGIACNNIHIWHGVGVYIGYKFLQAQKISRKFSRL